MLPLYSVGEVDWLTTQTLYHGLAEFGEEAVILCRPSTPYVCLGCHQSWSDYDESSGLPVVRRKVGGSLVYLDQNQVFFQIILNPRAAPGKRTPDQWYRHALDPVVAYLREQGFSAELRLPADIVVGGRKISGNAGGQLGDRVVVVGNILLDFPTEAMARARRAPSPLWRRAYEESMRAHLTTLRELAPDRRWSADQVAKDLAQVFIDRLGAVPAPFPWERWRGRLERIGRELLRDDWLRQPGPARASNSREVKVREGVYIGTVDDPRYRDAVVEIDREHNRILRVWRESFLKEGEGDGR